MITTRIEQQDDTFFAVIPDEDMERFGLVEGDTITFAINRIVDGRVILDPEMQKLADEILDESGDVFTYLADR